MSVRMKKSDSLRTLAELVEGLESAGYEVSDLRSREGSLVDDAGTAATVEVDLRDPIDGVDRSAIDVEASDASVTTDGRVRLSLAVRVAEDATRGPSTDGGPDADRRREPAGPGSDGSPDGSGDPGDATVGEPRASGPDPSAEAVAEPEAGDPDGPAHRDPERLREVYAEDRTFEEMRDALGVDVTAQTVRKHMVKHGIHTPDGRSSVDDGSGNEVDDEPPETRDGGEDADGGPTAPDVGTGGHDGDDREGLPTRTVDEIVDDIGIDRSPTIGDVVRAVHEHRTLYEAQQALGLADRDETRQLLEALNLLDLFHGRLSSDPGDEVTEDEIEARIRAMAGD